MEKEREIGQLKHGKSGKIDFHYAHRKKPLVHKVDAFEAGNSSLQTISSDTLNASASDKKIKELVVISGKGGTGKTSLVAAFCALEQNVAIADCDVDAADLHLVLNPEIKTTGIFSGGDTAVIDPDQCNGCGECYTQCHFDAILRIEKNGAQFLGMIPYDKKITEAQVKGLSVIKHTDEPMSLMIQSVWKRIRAKF